MTYRDGESKRFRKQTQKVNVVLINIIISLARTLPLKPVDVEPLLLLLLPAGCAVNQTGRPGIKT